MKTKCPCAQAGADGTSAHSESSGVTFRRVNLHTSTVVPCTNHLVCYQQSRSFEVAA